MEEPITSNQKMLSEGNVPLVPARQASEVGVAARFLSESAPSAKTSETRRAIHPLLSIRAHKLLASLIVLIVFVIGTPIAWQSGKARYYTEAAIRVSPKFPKILNDDREFEMQAGNQYREFVQQQVKTINRYDIVLDALNKLNEKKIPFQGESETQRRAAERLGYSLIIRPVKDTYLITVGLEGAKPDGLAEITNTVVETYLKNVKSEEFYAADERLENIQEERKRLVQELEQKTGERAELARQLSVTTFSGTLLNPYDQLLIKGKEALDEAGRKRIEMEAQLSALEYKQNPAGKSALDAMAEDLALKDFGLNTIKTALYTRRSQLVAKLSGLAPGHPGRRAIDRELAEIDAEIAKAAEKVTGNLHSMFLEQKRAELSQAKRIEKELAAKVQTESMRAMSYASDYHKAVALTNEIDRVQRKIEAIDDRIDFMTLESNAPAIVRMVSAARPPELPNKGGKRKTLTYFLFVALIALTFGFSVPVLIDYIDPRIHVPAELHGVMGFSPMGWILERKDEETRLITRDQLIRLATGLDRERDPEKTMVIAVTSAKPDGGTSTLVLDMAQALTRLGIRALAVEANSYSPDKRYRDARIHDGLVELIDDSATVEQVIAAGNNILPSRISIGRANGRRPLATINELVSTLQKLSKSYDILLLDLPPLYRSSDAELFIGLSDAVLLVVEAENTTRQEVTHATRTLERLSPPIVGAILNRVRAHSDRAQLLELLKEYHVGVYQPANGLITKWLWK